jgi:hypothetical protein
MHLLEGVAPRPVVVRLMGPKPAAFIVKAGYFEHPRQVRQGRVSQHAPKGLVSEQSQSDVLVTVDRATQPDL